VLAAVGSAGASFISITALSDVSTSIAPVSL
jgi:hypothetical protein